MALPAVRRYRPTDAAAVWAVHVCDLSDALPVFSTSWATDLHDVECNYLSRGDFLVAEDEAVVGTGGFAPVDEATAKLTRLRVLPEWRESGVFDDVVAALEALARERGYERAVLDSNHHLGRRNRALEARGYELVDRRPLPEWSTHVLYFERAL